MMGAMSYGMGMAAYVIHESVGGGASVTCTVLILLLLCHVRSGRPLGDMLHLELDNTTAECKNAEVMATVAWLVYHRKFRRARVFFLVKGDTKTVLDQSFGTLMTGDPHTCYPHTPSLRSPNQLSPCAHARATHPQRIS